MNNIFKYEENVIVGKPLVDPKNIFAANDKEWELIKDKIYYTEERFIPRLMVECGIVKSTSEVRRNKPELFYNLDKLDFIKIKWGKRFLWILVGE
ncbi:MULTISPECIES: hypothetical protein [unclassified Clostridioides]|uniref:hypothetical protein n=1 Tax=unclassified Clostridioides TaxID=2635829 RepID=UPI001D11FD9E|nr:hypothetical protein [Clostridioides sp. ES-W-0018-02]MCC0713023.1 hypothetical protein [Clostridioides sp. ES-W-0017-02]